MIKVADLDVIFISYDEPNCEYNWADLLNKFPRAKRVHKVLGLDNAHQAAGKLGKTDFIVTVDGDNIVDKEFFSKSFELKENQIYSWNGKNNINNLVYGNGGLKIWPKDWLEHMHIHDNNKVDFCWEDNYNQLVECYSETIQNGSEFQAFRSGLREGVKLSLFKEEKVEIARDFLITTHNWNIRALTIWCTIGRDIKYGEWAIYGARLGVNLLYFTTYADGSDWNKANISDYNWIDAFWDEKKDQLDNEMLWLGNNIRKLGLNIAEIDELQSKFFKDIM